MLGKMTKNLLHCKFRAESNGERILKIDQHLAKLLTKILLVFLTHTVEIESDIKKSTNI